MRMRYRYRFMAPGDREWQRLAFAGDRAGIAQRPAETFYEYASWLEQQLPARQVEIHQIADEVRGILDGAALGLPAGTPVSPGEGHLTPPDRPLPHDRSEGEPV